MSSSLRTKFTIDIAGAPVQFAQPFVQSYLETEQAPAQYEVTIDADSAATVWDGAPLGATFDFVALYTTQDGHVEFTVNGGEADEYHFTVPIRAGGFPVTFPGGQSYAGQSGTEDSFVEGTLAPITKIRVLNSNTTDPMVVSVVIAQEAE